MLLKVHTHTHLKDTPCTQTPNIHTYIDTDTHAHRHNLAKYSSVGWTSLFIHVHSSSSMAAFTRGLLHSLFKHKTNVDNRRDAKWLPLYDDSYGIKWKQRIDFSICPPLPPHCSPLFSLQSTADQSKAGSISFQCQYLFPSEPLADGAHRCPSPLTGH